MLKAYDLARQQRERPRGMTTDNEQDLLRSMLVMAAAGLDATAKQLVQDTLSHLISFDDRARNSFEKFVARRLTADPGGTPVSSGLKLLAAALATPSPQIHLIKEYVNHLTGSSLQSTESLFEVAAALGADPNEAGLTPKDLDPIFATRNKIIHELDINLEARMRKRNVRSQRHMIHSSSRLLKLGSAFLLSVDKIIQHRSQVA
jgi:hypothetical protein